MDMFVPRKWKIGWIVWFIDVSHHGYIDVRIPIITPNVKHSLCSIYYHSCMKITQKKKQQQQKTTWNDSKKQTAAMTGLSSGHNALTCTKMH